jgi:hypothetical protein
VRHLLGRLSHRGGRPLHRGHDVLAGR